MLSSHHIATHVLAPGDGYNLATRQPIVGGSAVAHRTSRAERFEPRDARGSGPLLLGGGVSRPRR